MMAVEEALAILRYLALMFLLMNHMPSLLGTVVGAVVMGERLLLAH